MEKGKLKRLGLKNRAEIMTNGFAIFVLLLFFLGFGYLIHLGLLKMEGAECRRWQKEGGANRSGWQVDQCEAVGYPLK